MYNVVGEWQQSNRIVDAVQYFIIGFQIKITSYNTRVQFMSKQFVVLFFFYEKI